MLSNPFHLGPLGFPLLLRHFVVTFRLMPVGQAVLLIHPQPTPASFKKASKSFICHRSENSPVSPLLATLPKSLFCKSFVCHTSDTPHGSSVCFSRLSLRATASLRTGNSKPPSPVFRIFFQVLYTGSPVFTTLAKITQVYAGASSRSQCLGVVE